MEDDRMVAKQYRCLDYVVRMPKDFCLDKNYPLVIYLHGAGGRGRNIETILKHSFFAETAKWLEDAICIAPQCYENSWFSIFEQLQEFVQYAIFSPNVDTARVYLVGASMGGYAVWQMAMSHPEWFAAIIPICGGGMYWNAGRLIHMGVWAFHGEKDRTVFCEESRKMVEAICKNGGTAKLTVYGECEHNAWIPTFRNQAVWNWLLSHKLHYQQTKLTHNNVEQFG